MKNHLPVSEVFYSIQGEGKYSGYPAVFLRLGGCNLLCKSKSWVCDTIEVWKHSKQTKFENCISPEIFTQLSRGNTHLVITGGEPLLHASELKSYIQFIDRKLFPKQVFIEVETNGTIIPLDHYLNNRVNSWNVSFKLSTSGEPYAKRINETAIQHFMEHEKAMFKIVISSEEDVLELLADFKIPYNKLILMPAGATREELNKSRVNVAEAVKVLGCLYSDRLHIGIWDKKTGV